MPFAAAHGLLLADIVAKLENQTSLKISQKPMFRRLARCDAPCIPTRGTKVPDRPEWLLGLEGLVYEHRESNYRGGRHSIAVSLIGAQPSRCYPTRRCS